MVPRPPTARDYTAGANAGAKKDFAALAAVATEGVRYCVCGGARCGEGSGRRRGARAGYPRAGYGLMRVALIVPDGPPRLVPPVSNCVIVKWPV